MFSGKVPNLVRQRSFALMISIGDKIASCHTRKKYEVTELGIMYPEEVPTDCLRPGQVGFVACSMKESAEGSTYLRLRCGRC